MLNLDIEHEPRSWMDGGDRYYLRIWNDDDSADHARNGWPLAVCPTQAAAELIRNAVNRPVDIYPDSLEKVARDLR